MGDWSVDMPAATGAGAACFPGGDSPGDASTPELDYETVDGCWDGIITNDTSPSADDLFLLGDDAEMGSTSLSKIDENVPEPWEKLSQIAAANPDSSSSVKVEPVDSSKAVPFLVFSEPEEAAGQKRKADSMAVKPEPHDEDMQGIDDPQMAELAARDPSTLSAEELKLLKKQKRLVRNRQSAQLSRQRKKSHMETLEIQVQELERERRALVARVDLLTRENQYLRKQLAATGRRPSSLPPPPPMPVPARLGRGGVLLGLVFVAGMLCSQTDLIGAPAALSPAHNHLLPQLYVPGAEQGVEVMGGVGSLVDGGAGRGHGRVLLSTDEGFREGYREEEGKGELSRQEVLIVTLLDHLAASHPAHAAQPLLPRLCARLQELGVLSSCQWQGRLEEVRQRFVSEFWAFRQEFFASPADAEGSSFSFSREEPRVSTDMSLSYSQAQIGGSLPRPPLFPLSPLAASGNLKAPGLSSDLNFLCPAAQLLIADRPANPAAPVAPAVQPEHNATVDEDGWLHVPLEEEKAEAEAEGAWKPTVLADGATVSMMLPRETLEGVNMNGAHLEMPEGRSRMVEFRCKAFDLHPFHGLASGLLTA